MLSSECHLQHDNVKSDVAGPRCGIAGAAAPLSHQSWGKHKCPLKIQQWEAELTGCRLQSNFILGSDESGEEILYFSQKLVPINHRALPCSCPKPSYTEKWD